MVAVLILFVVLLFWLWYFRETKKQSFPTKKGVWHYQKGDWPWEEWKRVAWPETIDWEIYVTARLNIIDYDIKKSLPSGRLTKQFISECWVLHKELHPINHVKRGCMSMKLRRAIRSGKGWKHAVLNAKSKLGWFNHKK